jgi:hypothetical protein
MTTKSNLSAIYAKLVKDATALPRHDHATTLRNGARIALRLRNGVQTVTFSRSDVEVGEIELATFQKHCSIPAHAKRIPAEGQGERNEGGRLRRYVAYRWSVVPETQAQFALLPGARNTDEELFPE